MLVTRFKREVKPKFHRAGMTLIEIMIAVALLTGVMAMGWGSYSVAVSHQQRMQDINERLHGVEQAVNRIVRDMSTAFITKHGDDETQTEIRYKTGFVGDEKRVDFTSMGYVRMFRDEKVGDQSEISYYVQPHVSISLIPLVTLTSPLKYSVH